MLPKQILNNILWSFDIDKFANRTSFESAVIQYNETIKNEPITVNFDSVVLKTPQVCIQYSYWDEVDDDIIEPDFLLGADNQQSFTISELLFKIHNKVCEDLKNDDHHFFEGLTLWEGEHPNYPQIPLYFLQQGS